MVPEIDTFLSPYYFVSMNTLFYHTIRFFMKVTMLCQEVSRERLWMSYITPNQNGAKKGSAAQIIPPPSIIFRF